MTYVPSTSYRPNQAAVFILMLSAAGLAGIGIWPNFLFPLLWISPLLITRLPANIDEGTSHFLADRRW